MKLALLAALALSANAAIVNYNTHGFAVTDLPFTYEEKVGTYDGDLNRVLITTVTSIPIICSPCFPYYDSELSGVLALPDVRGSVQFGLVVKVTPNQDGTANVRAFFPNFGAPIGVYDPIGSKNELYNIDPSQPFTLDVYANVTPEPATYALTALSLWLCLWYSRRGCKSAGYKRPTR